jgi:hypothetical protein
MAELEPVPSEVVDDDADVDGSLVSRLRQHHKTIADQKTRDFDIPGYGDGELFCRYHLLEGRQIDAIARKVRATIRNRAEQTTAATCDNLIAACDEFFVRDQGREIPVREVPGYKGDRDVPCRYGIELAEFLGFANELGENPSARKVVIGLFGGNDVAVSMHGARVVQWMTKGSLEVDMEMGEL